MSCSEQIVGSFGILSSKDALTLTLLLLAALKITTFFMLYDFSPSSRALLGSSAIKVRHNALCRFQWVCHTQSSVGVSHGAFSQLTCGTAQLRALAKHWVLCQLEILVFLILKCLFTTFKVCKIQVPSSV